MGWWGGCRGTYKGLVDVLPDVRHYLGVVATGQDSVQGMLLDGLQQASGVPEAQDAGSGASQPLHEVVHSHIGWGTTQDLRGEKPRACNCQGQQTAAATVSEQEAAQQRERDQRVSTGNKPLTSPQPQDTKGNSHLVLKH